MGKQKNIEKQLDSIVKSLQKFPKGASLQQLSDEADFNIELRTLQRRLEKLRDMGKVVISGKTSATRYNLVNREEQEWSAPASPTIQPIPLSEQGIDILSLVSRSLQQRQPAGYNREFLESYRPNTDQYLTNQELVRLAQMGNTSIENQPAGTFAKEILHRLLIDLSWNSSRLEGNTYSLLDTERLIQQGQEADNKTKAESQMILNHKDAIEFMVSNADQIGYNRYTLLNLHAMLANNLLPDPEAPGRLRRFGIGINGSVYTPLVMPQLIEEIFHLLLDKISAISNPFEQAFFAMVHLPYLQPFEDVNKRVSRLAANLSLNRLNLVPLSFIDVPNDLYTKGLMGIYELNRVDLLKDVFLWAYERSSGRYAAIRQSLGEPDPFRLKYREVMRSLITEIVAGGINKSKASVLIKKRSIQLPDEDQAKFIEATETELLSLHEGNFARYKVTPSEFRKWQSVWNEAYRSFR